jgi:hypothetical protein
MKKVWEVANIILSEPKMIMVICAMVLLVMFGLSLD